jgi:hypothetical protein
VAASSAAVALNTAGGVRGQLGQRLGHPTFANWPQSRFDTANTGINPNESSIDSTNAAHLQQAWVRTDDQSSNAAPAVVDNIIYLGCGAAMCAVKAPDQVLTQLTLQHHGIRKVLREFP